MYRRSGNAGTRVEYVHEHQRFDDAAATWDDDPGHEKRQVAIAQAIKEAVNLSPRMSAVDVGAGTGRLSILLADLVGSVVVTDPSAGMVQVARQRIEAAGLGDRLRAVQADLTTDRLDGAYDVVWSSMALHHVQDLDGLLRSVAGLLVKVAGCASRILTRIRTARSTPTRPTSTDITDSTSNALPRSWPAPIRRRLLRRRDDHPQERPRVRRISVHSDQECMNQCGPRGDVTPLTRQRRARW